MKLTAFILALFVSTLTAVPCADMEYAIDLENTTETENHSDHSDDGCTTFCVCACCGIAFPLGIGFFEEETFAIENTSHQFNHENLFTQGYINSIWYPPTLS